MALEIWSNDRFDSDHAPVREAAGELWRRHLDAFHHHPLLSGQHHGMPRGPQITEPPRRSCHWAATPANDAILAEPTPEGARRKPANARPS